MGQMVRPKEKQDIARLAEEELANNIVNGIEAEIASTQRVSELKLQ